MPLNYQILIRLFIISDGLINAVIKIVVVVMVKMLFKPMIPAKTLLRGNASNINIRLTRTVVECIAVDIAADIPADIRSFLLNFKLH